MKKPEDFGIKNYSFDDKGFLNVTGDVDLEDKRLKKIPFKFGVVSGGFYCSWNQLENLEGSPTTVGGSFICSENQLTSLEGCPSTVSGDFYCYSNQLKSLEGCPSTVGGDFNIDNTKELRDSLRKMFKGWKFKSKTVADMLKESLSISISLKYMMTLVDEK